MSGEARVGLRWRSSETGETLFRHLSIVILDKIEPDKDAVYLFYDCGVLAQQRGNVRATAEAA